MAGCSAYVPAITVSREAAAAAAIENASRLSLSGERAGLGSGAEDPFASPLMAESN